MKPRRFGVSRIVTAGAALLLLAGCAAVEQRPPSADARQRVVLAAAERDTVLAEMRGMLESVAGIVQGLGAGDLARAERAARVSGLAVAVDVDPRLMKKLPEPFRQLGMQTHKGFDGIADRIKTGAMPDDVLKALGTVTANCVACHAGWRLDETP